MNNKKKIVIVGGGIVGFISANYLLNLGLKDISIYETSKNFGGILKDQIIDNEFYFTSCQYLNPDQNWYKIIPNNIRSKSIYEFNHNYYSFTEMENMKNFEENFAGPVFTQKPSLKKKNIYSNFYERLKIYPKEISSFIIKWLSAELGNLKLLTSNSSYGLSLRRFYFKEYKNAVLNNKKLDYIDETHGIKRKDLKLKKLKGSLPNKGYNSFFENYKKYLAKLGVKFYNSSPVKIEIKQNKLSLSSLAKKIEFDHLLWTGNPTSLIKQAINKQLESKHVKSINIFFKLNLKINNTFYIQVFSLKTKINRIFFYPSNKICKITVECFDHDFNIKEIKKYIIVFLKNLKFKITDLECLYVGHVIQKNYTILSKRDESHLKLLKKKNKELHILDCGWELYGRDLKLNTVFDSIKSEIVI